MQRSTLRICLAAAGRGLVRSAGMETSPAYEAGQNLGQSFLTVLVVVALLGGGIFFVIAMVKATTAKSRGWIIGVVVSGLVALCGLLGAAGLAARSLGKVIQSNKAAAERKIRLVSDDGRYRIEVPGTWKSMRELNEEAGIAAGNAIREQYVLVIENPKSDYVGDLDSFDELTVELISDNLEKPELSDSEDRPVGSYPARHRRLVGTTENVRIVYQLASIETDDAFYQLMMWTVPSREAASKEVFREVVDSFTAKAEK
jgi:hypothetical protein